MKTSCPGNLIASTKIFYLKKTTLLSHKSFLSLVNLICLNIISSLEMVVTLGLTMCSYTAHFCFNPDNCFHYLESFLILKKEFWFYINSLFNSGKVEIDMCHSLIALQHTAWASQMAVVGTNPPANARDMRLIPGWGRSLREGNSNPLQYSCLWDPMDRGAWWTVVQGVAKSGHHWALKTQHRQSTKGTCRHCPGRLRPVVSTEDLYISRCECFSLVLFCQSVL